MEVIAKTCLGLHPQHHKNKRTSWTIAGERRGQDPRGDMAQQNEELVPWATGEEEERRRHESRGCSTGLGRVRVGKRRGARTNPLHLVKGYPQICTKPSSPTAQ